MTIARSRPTAVSSAISGLPPVTITPTLSSSPAEAPASASRNSCWSGEHAAFRTEIEITTTAGRILYATRSGGAPIVTADLAETLRLAGDQRPDLLGAVRGADGSYWVVAVIPEVSQVRCGRRPVRPGPS